MKFPPLTRADTAAFADCLFLAGQAWVRRALGDDQGAVEYLADAMVMVPDGTVEMILGMIEGGALPEPVPGAMDPWLECCRQAGAGELRLTVARSPSAPAAPAPSPHHLETQAEFPGRLSQYAGADLPTAQSQVDGGLTFTGNSGGLYVGYPMHVSGKFTYTGNIGPVLDRGGLTVDGKSVVSQPDPCGPGATPRPARPATS